MIVDPATGEDLREAEGFEVEHIRRTGNFSGIAKLGSRTVTMRKLGGCP